MKDKPPTHKKVSNARFALVVALIPVILFIAVFFIR